MRSCNPGDRAGSLPASAWFTLLGLGILTGRFGALEKEKRKGTSSTAQIIMSRTDNSAAHYFLMSAKGLDTLTGINYPNKSHLGPPPKHPLPTGPAAAFKKPSPCQSYLVGLFTSKVDLRSMLVAISSSISSRLAAGPESSFPLAGTCWWTLLPPPCSDPGMHPCSCCSTTELPMSS